MRFFVQLFLMLALAVTLRGPLTASEPAPTAMIPEQANLGGYAHVSARFLADLLHREIKLSQQVVDTILNMTTRGNAQIDCQIGIELVPNPQVAQVRLTASGQAIMNDTIGTMRSIQVSSSSRTQINGAKEVFFNPQGLRLLPARSDCRTSLQINDIDANRRIVERLAWRRADRMQPQAEQEVSRRIARRAEQQIDAQAGKPLAQLNEAYVDEVYAPLVRQGAFPEMRLSTTPEHLSITLFSQISDARGPSPPAPAFDVAVCLGDSFVNALFAPLLAGKTITDRQLANLMQTLIGQTPRALWIHERAEPWSLTAAKERPLSLAFDEGRVSITLRIDGAARGEQHLDRPLEIAAAYSLAITRDGPRLTRLGEVSVAFSDDDARPTDEGADGELRQFLHRKFVGVFPAELYFDGLTPPAGGSWSKFRQLTLTRFSSGHGWLAIGYELPSTPAILAATTAKGAGR
jgi:hypothetical protein